MPSLSARYRFYLHTVSLLNTTKHQRADGGTYELYQPPKDSPKDMSDYIADAKRGVGRAAIFIARSRFAVLDKSSQVEIKNLKNELTKSFKVASNVDQIYYGGTGNILLRAEDSVSLYDINQKKVPG